MEATKVLIASLLFTLIVFHVVEGLQSNPSQMSSKTPAGTTGNVVTGAKIDCAAACDFRCSETKRPNLCKRACGSCCRECKCVPPGTSGNHEVCPCYATKTTRGNVRKCP